MLLNVTPISGHAKFWILGFIMVNVVHDAMFLLSQATVMNNKRGLFIFTKLCVKRYTCITNLWAGSGSSIGCTSSWYSGRRFDPSVRQRSFVEIGHEIISIAILSVSLIQVGQLSVTGKRMCTK